MKVFAKAKKQVNSFWWSRFECDEKSYLKWKKKVAPSFTPRWLRIGGCRLYAYLSNGVLWTPSERLNARYRKQFYSVFDNQKTRNAFLNLINKQR